MVKEGVSLPGVTARFLKKGNTAACGYAIWLWRERSAALGTSLQWAGCPSSSERGSRLWAIALSHLKVIALGFATREATDELCSLLIP